MAIAGITISASRQEAVDFTLAYVQEPSAVAIKIVISNQLYFVQPLNSSLLSTFLLMPIAAGLSAWLLAKMSKTFVPGRNRSQRAKREPGLLKIIRIFYENIILQGQYSHQFLLEPHLILCIVNLTGDGEGMRLGGVRPLEVCVRLITLVVVAVYCGNLTATLAVPKVKWPFTDLRGLANSKDYHLLIQEGTIREDLLSVSSKREIIIMNSQEHIPSHSFSFIIQPFFVSSTMASGFFGYLSSMLHELATGSLNYS